MKRGAELSADHYNPGGGLDQVAGGVAGQIWKTHMCSEGEHVWSLSVKSSSHTSGRIFCGFDAEA